MDAPEYRAPGFVGIRKTHLRLRRMHVHVHEFRGHFQEHVRLRRAAETREPPIGLGDRVEEPPIPDRPPVHEEQEARGSAARRHGRRKEGTDRELPGARLDRNGVPGPAGLELLETSGGVFARFEREHLPVAAFHVEAHLRPREGEILDRLDQMRGFGLLPAQEFSSRGGVEEEVPHFHHRPGRHPGRPVGQHGSTLDLDFPPGVGLLFPGAQPEPGYRGDRGQRFAPEPERADGGQVIHRFDLAGGVTFEGEPRVLGAHPDAVVAHPDLGLPRALDAYGNVRGPGIDRVLDQLADHRRRPLDHLPGSDLVGHRRRQPMDRQAVLGRGHSVD